MNRPALTGKARCADLITFPALGALLLGLLLVLPGCPNSQGNSSSADGGSSARAEGDEKGLDASGNEPREAGTDGKEGAKDGSGSEGAEGPEAPPEEETLVVATHLYEGPIESFIEVSSDIETLNRVDLYPQHSGIQVIEVLADEGDEVKKGDVLAVLDPAEIQLELAQAEANYNEVKQRLLKAEVSVKEARERTRNALLAEAKARNDYEKSEAMSKSELVLGDGPGPARR